MFISNRSKVTIVKWSTGCTSSRHLFSHSGWLADERACTHTTNVLFFTGLGFFLSNLGSIIIAGY